MSATSMTGNETAPGSDMSSALFAHLVVQQANMAMMLLGKTPNPETGQTMRDLEAAKLLIETHEMLETNTKGNLGSHEQNMLKQTFMTVRLDFVKAANAPSQEQKPTPEPSSAPGESPIEKTSAPAEESHKKFSKKY